MRDVVPEGLLAMKDLTHTVLHEGRIVTYSWLGDANVPVARVRALPFIPDGRMLLASGAPSDPCCYPPGGGVEAFDETPEAALRRELMEEAATTIHALKRLGAQRRYDPAVGTEYSAFYWCRITLADASVPTELERTLVSPEDYLDTLFWGRSDPTAAILLEKALACERQFEQGT